MDIENIQIDQLPAVQLIDHKKLPAERGLYFVVSNGEIIYIGMSSNFLNRFQGHHKIFYFRNYPNTQIRWFETDTVDLAELEKKAIKFFNPRLNGTPDTDLEDPNAIITFTIPKSLHKKAREKSKSTGVSISFVARKAIEEWVEKAK